MNGCSLPIKEICSRELGLGAGDYQWQQPDSGKAGFPQWVQSRATLAYFVPSDKNQGFSRFAFEIEILLRTGA